MFIFIGKTGFRKHNPSNAIGFAKVDDGRLGILLCNFETPFIHPYWLSWTVRYPSSDGTCEGMLRGGGGGGGGGEERLFCADNVRRKRGKKTCEDARENACEDAYENARVTHGRGFHAHL